jgi:hypothetical protein
MAILGMIQTEYDYYVDSLREAMALIGQEAILYQVDVEEKDLYRDPSVTYKEAVNIALIFEENPRPILKQLNWLTEDEELPYVAHIVALASNKEPIVVRENMKIRIPSKYGLETDRVFVVTRVNGNHIDPVEWVCKLVPYRERVDVKPETPEYDRVRVEGKQDTSYSYLTV